MIVLRPMTQRDLFMVDGWLRLPHVARSWLTDTTAEAEIAEYQEQIDQAQPATTMLMVTEAGRSIGWCQWYCWADYAAEAVAIQAREGEVGIDYAIGDPASIGHGSGTALIAALVTEVRRHCPAAGVLADPDATNAASRRVLEKNGFGLVDTRSVVTEPNDAPMAIYRLPALP